MLTALSKAEGLRCAASFVTAAYCKYALTFYEIIRFSNGEKAAKKTDLISRWKADISERE
jgi:hypothetical protein